MLKRPFIEASAANCRAPKKSRVGEVYGRLTVIDFAGRKGDTTYWKCMCECGTVKIVGRLQLRSGDAKSCGCLFIEMLKSKATHGRCSEELRTTPLRLTYVSWTAAKSRTLYPSLKSFQDYGGRGVKMCSGWIHSFETFLRDMGERPSKKHTIERIDCNGHYSCGHCGECVENGWIANCCWATRKEQMLNTRRSVWLEKDGVVKHRSEWMKESGWSHMQMDYRRKKGLFKRVSKPSYA